MVDQHIGYPGTVGSTALANWLTNMLAQYSVDGPNDCKVVTTGADRGVQVLSGKAIGDGILDIFETAQPLQLGTISSGDRWDMIVLRRTWSAVAGSSTTLPVIIPGTAAKQLPTRLNNKGVQADQPLALCRVRAGQTAVQEIVDLRVWAHNGGAYAVDDLVKDYLNEPGTALNINGIRWYRSIAASPSNNVAAWSSPDLPGPWVAGTYYSGWRTVTNGIPFSARLLGNGLVHVIGECIYEGPGTVLEGWSPGVLPSQFWPANVCYLSGTSNNYSLACTYYAYQGEIRFLGTGQKGTIAQFNGIYPLR